MLKGITLLMLLVVGMSFGFCQTQISEEMSNVRLVKAFRILEKKYGLRIGYDVKLIGKRRVTAKIKNASPKEALNLLLDGTGLDFTISSDTYVAVFPGKAPVAKKPAKKKEYTYQGWIYDEENESAIPFAKIKIAGTNLGAYSDEDGKFLFTTTSKKGQFEISALGYSKVIVDSDEFRRNKGLKVALKVDVKDFPEVVVEYLAEGMTVSKDISRLDIRPSRLGVTSGTVDPDVFINLQNVPGINSANGTVSEMQIRGGTSDQNLLLWEGITLYHSGHFNGMLSSINPYIVDESRVYRGVYDPYYGGRASGLIEMFSLPKIPSSIEAGGGVNLISADAYIKMPIGKKLGIMVSGRRSFVATIQTPTYKKYANRIYQETQFRQSGEVYDESFEDSLVLEEETQNSFYFTDVNAKVRFEPTKKSSISTSLMYTNNELFYETMQPLDSSSSRNFFQTRNFGASVDWTQKWNTRWTSKLNITISDYTYVYQDQFEEKDEGETFQSGVSKSNRINTIGWRWSNRVLLNEKNSLHIGYQGDVYEVDYGIVESEDSVDLFAESDTTQLLVNVLHGMYEWKNNKWMARAGARLSHLSRVNEVYVDPRIYFQYILNRKVTFKAGGAIQHQFISQVEDLEQAQLGLSNRIWVLSDFDGVPVVRSSSVNAGFLLRLKGWHVEVDGYLKDIQGISNFADDKSMSSGFDRGVAGVKGIDFLVKKRWKGWRAWVSYTLSDVLYSFEEDSLGTFAAPFNQPHVVKAITSLNWRNWEGALTFKIASGKPYTRLLGLKENPEGVIGGDLEDDFIFDYGPRNGAKLPIYHRLDLSIFYTLKKSESRNPWKLKFGISLLNVYDQSNYLSRTYRLEVTEDDLGNQDVETLTIDRYYLRFTPNATIRFEFGE
ncbi:MAG: TonB-dependent receptor [Crocinitomicaceae bacterium]|nr:TonB-dependent receptor [Crocinitomicaceae bacterium]